jgi:hypothetical protein
MGLLIWLTFSEQAFPQSSHINSFPLSEGSKRTQKYRSKQPFAAANAVSLGLQYSRKVTFMGTATKSGSPPIVYHARAILLAGDHHIGRRHQHRPFRFARLIEYA